MKQINLVKVEHQSTGLKTKKEFDDKYHRTLSDQLALMVILTGPEWNTLIDAVIELDKNLKSIGLGGDDSGPWP